MTSLEVNHYVICQHGLFGNRIDFARLVEHFNHPNTEVNVIVLTGNEGLVQTLDGVIPAGDRCCTEILELLWNQRIPAGSTLSVLGHSMGGLYLRYALRKIQIEHSAVWEEFQLKRKYAIFVASPHCGIWSSSWLVRISCNYLLKYIVNTAKDAILASTVLVDLSDDHGIESLNMFERVVLYGNQARDKVVSASSALILSKEYIPPKHVSQRARSEVMTITEYLMSTTPEEDKPTLLAPKCPNSRQCQIVRKLNNGLRNVSRFLVDSPSKLPSMLQQFDNTAHTRIICHGLLDRSRVGLPMIDHLERILGGAENVVNGVAPTT